MSSAHPVPIGAEGILLDMQWRETYQSGRDQPRRRAEPIGPRGHLGMYNVATQDVKVYSCSLGCT